MFSLLQRVATRRLSVGRGFGRLAKTAQGAWANPPQPAVDPLEASRPRPLVGPVRLFFRFTLRLHLSLTFVWFGACEQRFVLAPDRPKLAPRLAWWAAREPRFAFVPSRSTLGQGLAWFAGGAAQVADRAKNFVMTSLTTTAPAGLGTQGAFALKLDHRVTPLPRDNSAAEIAASNGVAGGAGCPPQLVFISPEIAALVPQEELAGARVFVLDATQDAIAQVGLALQAHPGASVVRVISHGEPGSLMLAGQRLTRDTLRDRSAEIAGWRKHLAPGADILLYGCSVAGTPDGRSFVNTLAALTESDVAASANLTGSATLGGDLTLEYATGAIEARTGRFGPGWDRAGLILPAPAFSSNPTATFTRTLSGSFTAVASGSPTYSIAQKTHFASDFTTLPEPWMVTGHTALSGGACVLTAAQTDQAGALILPKLGADSPGSFTATFDYTVTGVTAGDGLSLNYGVLANTTGSVSSMLSTGLVVTFIESGTPRIDVLWNNVVVGSATNTFAGTATAVEIKLDGSGLLTVSYGGVQKIALNLGSKVTAADRSHWQFAFGAATTASSNSHAIDNLAIVSNGALPAGLTLNAGTGVITGTATTANNAGVQAFNLVATNGDGATAQYFSLTVASGAPIFTSAATSPTVPGVTGLFTVAASGTAGATTYGVGKTLISTTLADATTLPTGASLSGSAQFNAGALELTQNVVSQTGRLQFLGAGADNPSSFSASFNYSLGGGTTPAGDGISFLYGPPGDITKGLRVRINENNAGSNANLVISMYKDGILTAQQLLTNPYLSSYSFRPVTIKMSDEGRLQVRVNGALAFDTGVYSNWQSADKSLWAFAFQGENVSSYTNFHTIKDVVIATNGVLPPGLSLDTSTGVIT